MKLDLNPDIICHIIAKAREFHAKEEVVIPEEQQEDSSEYDWAQVLADHVDDETYQELKTVINNDLEHDQKVELVAVMYLGRGDFDIKEWQDALMAAEDVPGDNIAEYLLSIPMVADYLTDGLYELGYNCNE